MPVCSLLVQVGISTNNKLSGGTQGVSDLSRVTLVDGMTSQKVMSLDSVEIPGKAIKKRLVE